MSEPNVFDQLFGQQDATTSDVASQLFGGPVSTNSVASQLFDDTNGIEEDENPEDENDLDPDEHPEYPEGVDGTEEDEDLANEQESVLSQLFGANSNVADQLFGGASDVPSQSGASVEDQLFGDASTNEPSVHDQLFGGPAEFVEGGFEGPSPEMVIAMLSNLLIPKPVSGTGNVNITFQGPVTFNL